MAKKETADDKVSTPEEQVDSTEEESVSPSEEQPTEEKEETPTEEVEAETPEEEGEKLIAGKFRTQDDLVKGYQELESKLGKWKEVEDKAAAFDEMSSQQAPALPTEIPSAPNAQDYVNADGNLDLVTYQRDVNSYNTWMINQSSLAARQAAREENDKVRIEQEFPEIKDNDDFAKTVVSLYRSGASPTLYEAAKQVDRLRQSEIDRAKREGATIKEREIAQKIRSKTEQATAKISESMSEEDFAQLPLEDKRKVVQQMVKEQEGR